MTRGAASRIRNLAFVVAAIACASTPKASPPAAADQVADLTIPFELKPPLTPEDGIQIADVIRGLLRREEHVHCVDPIPCTSSSCVRGIEQLAEALILTGLSDM